MFMVFYKSGKFLLNIINNILNMGPKDKKNKSKNELDLNDDGDTHLKKSFDNQITNKKLINTKNNIDDVNNNNITDTVVDSRKTTENIYKKKNIGGKSVRTFYVYGNLKEDGKEPSEIIRSLAGADFLVEEKEIVPEDMICNIDLRSNMNSDIYESKNDECLYCKSTDHKLKDCNDVFCFTCGKKTHKTNECGLNLCQRCGKKEFHSFFQCILEYEEEYIKPTYNDYYTQIHGCFKCGESGHVYEDCGRGICPHI